MKQLVLDLRCASEPEGSDVLLAVVVLLVGSYCVAQGAVLGNLAGVGGGHGDQIVGQSEGQVQHYCSVWKNGGVDGHLLLGSVEETEGSQGQDNLVEGLRGSFFWVQSMWLREVLIETVVWRLMGSTYRSHGQVDPGAQVHHHSDVWGPGRGHLGVVCEGRHHEGHGEHQKQEGGQVHQQDLDCGLCGGQGQGGKLEHQRGCLNSSPLPRCSTCFCACCRRQLSAIWSSEAVLSRRG